MYNNLGIHYFESKSKYYISYYDCPASIARIAMQCSCRLDDVEKCLKQLNTEFLYGAYLFNAREEIETFFTMLTMLGVVS